MGYVFGRLCLVLLSADHALLVCGFGWGWVLLAMEFVITPQPTMIFLLLVLQLCFVCTLIRFQSIDIDEKLKREIEQLKQTKDAAINKNQQMKAFWKPVEALVELWNYRTP